jgi:hypothetical protein
MSRSCQSIRRNDHDETGPDLICRDVGAAVDSVAKEYCAKISLLDGDTRDESQGAVSKTRLVQSSRLTLSQKGNERGAARKRCASAENQRNESYPIVTRPAPVMAPHQFPDFPPKGNRQGETKYDNDRHPGGFD